MKQCPKCKAEGIGPKSLSEFCKGSGSDGLQHACRDHTRQYNREWVKKNPEKNREKGKRFREQNPEAYRKLQIRAQLKNSYSLTETAFQQMFDSQQGCCAICQLKLINRLCLKRGINGHAPNEVARVDHDHAIGKVRGLLCFSCNVGLGKFRDDETLLVQALRYLRENATAKSSIRAQHETLQGERGPRERDPNRIDSRVNRWQELTPFYF